METEATGNYELDSSELEALMTRINELIGNMIKQENYLKEELATKKEDIASFTASIENKNIELAELHKQIADMKEINENNQSMIGGLRSLVTEQELQIKSLKEGIDAKEQVITSFAVSLENSQKEIAELQKQVDEMKAINESKIDLTTNPNSEPKVKEEITVQKENRKSQKKKLKRLLKEHPKASEKELAELLGVDRSSITKLRKEFDI